MLFSTNTFAIINPKTGFVLDVSEFPDTERAEVWARSQTPMRGRLVELALAPGETAYAGDRVMCWRGTWRVV